LRDWDASAADHPTDPDWFRREILPALQNVPYSLVRATGLTHGYLSQIRRGLKTPHPRHWARLATAADEVLNVAGIDPRTTTD
jgi:hypothetical protein